MSSSSRVSGVEPSSNGLKAAGLQGFDLGRRRIILQGQEQALFIAQTLAESRAALVQADDVVVFLQALIAINGFGDCTLARTAGQKDQGIGRRLFAGRLDHDKGQIEIRAVRLVPVLGYGEDAAVVVLAFHRVDARRLRWFTGFDVDAGFSIG